MFILHIHSDLPFHLALLRHGTPAQGSGRYFVSKTGIMFQDSVCSCLKAVNLQSAAPWIRSSVHRKHIFMPHPPFSKVYMFYIQNVKRAKPHDASSDF